MKEIGINLAGRLGNPSPSSPKDAEPAQKSSYGVSRLGIVSLDDADPAAPREPPAELPPEVLPPEVWDQLPQEEAPPASPLDLTTDEFVWEDSPPPAAAAETEMETAPKPAHGLSRAKMKWLAVTAAIVVALVAWRVWSHVASLPREAAGQRATLAPRPPVPVSPPANDPPAISAPVPTAKTNDNTGPRTANPPAGMPVPERRIATPATPVPSGLSPGVEDPQPRPLTAPRGSDGSAGLSLMKRIGRVLAPKAAPPAGPPVAPTPATPAPPVAAAPSEPAPVVSLNCPPGFLLTGIMRWADGPVAMINNRAVGVGGVVNGARVRKISDFSVEIELKGKIYRITVAATAAPPPADDEPAEEPEEKEAAAPTSQPAEEE